MKKLLSSAFLVLLSLAAFQFAQTPRRTPPPLIIEDKEILKIESRLVIVPVSVTDGNGNAVKGLSMEDFTVREETRKQEIAEVSDAEKTPLEIALLFDISGSTNPMFRFEQDTAAQFLREVMRPQDRASIFTIGEKVELVQTRDTSEQSVITVGNILQTRGTTAFFDSVATAAEYVEMNAPAKSRKVIITISDGEDNASVGVREGNERAYILAQQDINTLTTRRLAILRKNRDAGQKRVREKTLKRLQDADAVFYSINPAGSSYQLNKISQIGQGNMERFADETGGSAFLPRFLPIDLKSEFRNETNIATNLRTLEGIFTRLRSELQAQYLVQYYSDGEYPKAKYVDIKIGVDLKLPQGLTIRARRGYFVK